ncbi:chromate transporter [Microvirga sp. W0021]|uniref:Chromate transporter n=1 Tax=Hohaiivirga grylli TaxID=3133970 RepID=A0ABV0BHM7_9HYPH
MSETVISTSPPQNRLPPVHEVKCHELFIGFFLIGIVGFGGVMPWIRRMVVEQRRWLSEEEFINMLSICQILPGANVGNMAVCLGSRFAGIRGSVSAIAGLFTAPFFIVILFAIFYSKYAGVPFVENIFRGVSAAASGLVISMGIKIMLPVCRTPHAIIVTILAVMGITVLKLPLLWVVAILAPASILVLWLLGRR